MDEKQARFIRTWWEAWQQHLKREESIQESLLAQLNTLQLRVATLEKALAVQSQDHRQVEQQTLW